MTDTRGGSGRIDLLSLAPELGRAYRPIEREMEALNRLLHTEFRSPEPFLEELLVHIACFRGKQIRPACLFLAARCVGDTSESHITSGAVVELIHTATLVHDDLLDDARLRRRVETVNKRWGERAAVLLGDFIYSRGFSLSTEVEGVSKLLADTTHTICEGELLQVGSAFDTTLCEDRYNEIIHKKTAVLYGMASRIGAMLAGAREEHARIFESFGNSLGMAFQISDDALDLTGDEGVVGKSLGTDLKMGKMTLPLIRLREALRGGKLEEYLWLLEHPNEMGTHKRVHHMLLENDILKGVREIASGHVDEAIGALEQVPPSSYRECLMDLARFILDRHV
ncbi:MAG: polyprenyl synthetase family protein [Planctomycetota bacterium]